MYQPELGRFMQPDPKEFAAGDYNLYRYCHNDPVNKNDPTGLDPIGRLIGEIIGGYVFGSVGTEIGTVALGGTGAIIGAPEGGPVGVIAVGGTGALVGGVAGGVVGTGVGIKVGGDAGDYLGDRIKEGLNNIFESRGHTRNARPSSRERHEGGDARRQRDQHGGEKGDSRRDPEKDRRGNPIKPKKDKED